MNVTNQLHCVLKNALRLGQFTFGFKAARFPLGKFLSRGAPSVKFECFCFSMGSKVPCGERLRKGLVGSLRKVRSKAKMRADDLQLVPGPEPPEVRPE